MPEFSIAIILIPVLVVVSWIISFPVKILMLMPICAAIAKWNPNKPGNLLFFLASIPQIVVLAVLIKISAIYPYTPLNAIAILGAAVSISISDLHTFKFSNRKNIARIIDDQSIQSIKNQHTCEFLRLPPLKLIQSENLRQTLILNIVSIVSLTLIFLLPQYQNWGQAYSIFDINRYTGNRFWKIGFIIIAWGYFVNLASQFVFLWARTCNASIAENRSIKYFYLLGRRK